MICMSIVAKAISCSAPTCFILSCIYVSSLVTVESLSTRLVCIKRQSIVEFHEFVVTVLHNDPSCPPTEL